MRLLPLVLGVGLLAAIWAGPLPELAARHFSVHMTMHIGVVAIAAPLIGMAAAGRRFDPTARLPGLFSAIPASVVELIVVWGWHAPALHQFARSTSAGLFLEQGMFFASSLLVWMSSVGGDHASARPRSAAGVLALLLTSTHMTLLGALIALAPRPLYAHAEGSLAHGTLLDEQHLGGAIMLVVGGAAYLAGGLALARRLLRPVTPGAGEPA